jgi:exonuclease SbcD
LVGDIHIRENEQLDDVVRCLEFARQVAATQEVTAALIAGDVYEGKSSPEERAVAGRFLASLPCEAIVVKGNHDQPGELQIFEPYVGSWIAEEPIVIETGDVDVLCVPWPERAWLAEAGHTGEAGDQAGSAALAAMLHGMVATREHPERPLIILAHLQVLGAISSSAQPMIGRAIEAVLGDLQDLGAAAVVLGHIHKPQQLAPGVEYIGSLTCHDFGEEDEEKRIGVLTVEDDGTASVEWVAVPCRRWVTIEAKVGEDGTPVDEWPVALSEADEQLVISGAAGCNVRYRYACDEAEQHLFDHAEIERRFAAAHTLKIVAQVERAERVRAAEVAAAASTEDQLRAWGAATGTPVTDSHIEKLHQLESEAV